LEGIHIEKVDRNLGRLAAERLDSLTKPRGSLGRLEEFAQRIVAITGEKMPLLFAKKAIFTFAGDHGVVEEGVSLFPKEVTVQMVRNFLDGGAGINVLARHAGAEVVVVAVDFEITYDRIACVLRALLAGAILIGANADATYPTETGPRPGAGAFVGIVRGMGFTPQHMCGKPDPWAMRRALALRGFEPRRDCLLVGDRLDSDILGAHALGIDSALVLTGASLREDVERLSIRPTYVVDALPSLPSEFAAGDGRPIDAGGNAAVDRPDRRRT